MQKKFRYTYRIPSARKPGWDYAENGAYFITICTAGRVPYFGLVEQGIMQLSEIGHIAHDCWAEIPQHFLFVELGEFVIMPNHMHGIITINNRYVNPVETLHATSVHPATSVQQGINIFKNEKMANIAPKKGELPSVIRSYKSAVTRFVRRGRDVACNVCTSTPSNVCTIINVCTIKITNHTHRRYCVCCYRT